MMLYVEVVKRMVVGGLVYRLILSRYKRPGMRNGMFKDFEKKREMN